MGIDLFDSQSSVRAEKKDKVLALNQVSEPSTKTLSPKLSRKVQESLLANQENSNLETCQGDITTAHNPGFKKDGQVRESQLALRFSLNYYFLNEKLAVLEEIALSGSQFNRKDNLNLLRNILLALGVGTENQRFDAESISWPVAEGFSIPADQESAARFMLAGFIRRKSQEASFENLLVFTDTISDFFIRRGKAERIRDYFNETEGFHLTISQSLDTMLTHPDLKGDVWQQLQPLKKRITFG